MFLKLPSWFSICELSGSTMVEQCPKGAGWRTPVEAQNNSVQQKLKPIKQCRTSWTWPLKHWVMRRRAHRGMMLQIIVWMHMQYMLLFVLFVLYYLACLSLWRHRLNTIKRAEACTGWPVALTDCLLSGPCVPPALWCLSLIKRKSEDELSSVRTDLIYIRSLHLVPFKSPSTPTAQKRGRKLIIESKIAGEDQRAENGSSEYFTWK